jgi:transcriptional regulator with XRE-family HTH domain
MTPKDFINSLPTQKQLCEAIGWNTASMSRWLSGHRPIPKDKEQLLIEVLKKYGYGKTN